MRRSVAFSVTASADDLHLDHAVAHQRCGVRVDDDGDEESDRRNEENESDEAKGTTAPQGDRKSMEADRKEKEECNPPRAECEPFVPEEECAS